MVTDDVVTPDTMRAEIAAGVVSPTPTVMFYAEDVVRSPLASVARFVGLEVPAGPAVELKLHPSAPFVSWPSRFPFWKNSTVLTVPSLSLAFAEIATLAGALKDAPAVGLVIAIDGGEDDDANDAEMSI